MGPRSKNFRFKVDTKIELTFYMILKRFLYDSEAQDGAKMAPRWRQDEAKMASKCCFKSSIVPPLDFLKIREPLDLDFHRFWSLPGSIFEDFFVHFLLKMALENFMKILSFS